MLIGAGALNRANTVCSIFSIVQMYCYKQISVKHLGVIYTSIIKQKSELVSLSSCQIQVDIDTY